MVDKFIPTHMSPYGKPVMVLHRECYKYPSLVPGIVFTMDGWTYWMPEEQFNKTDKKRNREWPVLAE